MEFSYQGLDHVQLAAPEGCESETRLFFNEILGWTEIPKPETLQKRGGVWFRCGHHEVHIGVQQDFTPALKAHPAFLVQSIESLRTHLLSRNIQVIDDEARAEEGVTRFYTHDPFGNRIEFMERKM
ncbi:glyoxalase [Neobacillus mesonae]|nr:glyoxalase [Neobacillus mesonae]